MQASPDFNAHGNALGLASASQETRGIKKSRLSEQQIAFILNQAEDGTTVEEVCRKTDKNSVDAGWTEGQLDTSTTTY